MIITKKKAAEADIMQKSSAVGANTFAYFTTASIAATEATSN